jgi:hypothetical protein
MKNLSMTVLGVGLLVAGMTIGFATPASAYQNICVKELCAQQGGRCLHGVCVIPPLSGDQPKIMQSTKSDAAPATSQPVAPPKK